MMKVYHSELNIKKFTCVIPLPRKLLPSTDVNEDAKALAIRNTVSGIHRLNRLTLFSDKKKHVSGLDNFKY